MSTRGPVTRRAVGAGGAPETLLSQVLLPGEVVRWQGRPDPRARSSGYTRGCMSVPFLGFGGVGLAALLGGVVSSGIPASTRLFLAVAATIPLGLVFVGLILLSLPWRERAEAARSLHVVTDRRLLTIVGGRRADIVSIALQNLGPTHIAIGENGRGSIVIETHSRSYDVSTAMDITETYAWEGIDDAAAVHRLIEDLRERGRTNA